MYAFYEHYICTVRVCVAELQSFKERRVAAFKKNMVRLPYAICNYLCTVYFMQTELAELEIKHAKVLPNLPLPT